METAQSAIPVEHPWGVHRAILLATGQGGQLTGDTASHRPKCLAPIDAEHLLLDYQVTALAEAGVDRITMVVGRGAADVRQACARLAAQTGVAFHWIDNLRHATSNTLYSLYLARHAMTEPCFLIHGDRLFSSALLHQLSAAPQDGVLAVEPQPDDDEEEIQVSTDAQGRILHLGRHLAAEATLGAFVGVARLAGPAAVALSHALTTMVEGEKRLTDPYEEALARSLPAAMYHAVLVTGEPVVEIDFPEDLAWARTGILARLQGLAA